MNLFYVWWEIDFNLWSEIINNNAWLKSSSARCRCACNLTRSLCDSLNRTSEENCSIRKSLFVQIVFHPHSVSSFFCFICMYAQSTKHQTCRPTRKHIYCFFVIHHVGKARLDTLVTLDTFVSTRSTKSNVSSWAKWNLGLIHYWTDRTAN